MQKVEHLPDGGIKITNTIEFPEWLKEKLEGMADEEAEALLDRIKSEIQSKMAEELYSTHSKAIEYAILGSWRMPHMTDPFSEPPFTPERFTYDGLGEYGKDWIELDYTPTIKIKENE